MSERKIVAYKVAFGSEIEFNSQCSEYLAQGYEPYGDLKTTYTPTYPMNGGSMWLGGEAQLSKEFVKYEKC